MAEWALIDLQTKEILEYHDKLPKNWQNVSGLDLSVDNKSFLRDLGWFPVVKADVSFDSNTQVVTGHTYSKRRFDVLETPTVEDKPPVYSPSDEQIKNDFFVVLRKQRDIKLVETDWTQLVDVQGTLDAETKQKWLVYRQALRDLPQLCETNSITSTVQIEWPVL